MKLAIARLSSFPDPWVSATARQFSANWKALPKSPRRAQQVTRSLKVEDLKIGTGTEFSVKDEVLGKGDRAVIEFEGKLPDGTIFETNYNSEESPICVTAGSESEIEGLSLGVLGMRPGGTRKLTIPAALAYGPVGAGAIPPYCDVIYTVKLLHIDRSGWFDPPPTRDVRLGKGPQAELGSRVTYRWKAWLVTGRSITAKTENPATLDLVPSPFLEALQAALIGMRPGGVRRALVREFKFGEATGFGFDKVVMELELLSVVDKP